jgi:hypothetical protein
MSFESPSPWISEVTIPFEEAVEKVNKLKIYCAVKGIDLNFTSIPDRLNQQEKIRDYIKETWGCLGFPNTFALFALLIAPENTVTKWLPDVMESVERCERTTKIVDDGHCCCGHYLTQYFIITNEITKRSLIVGSHCLVKYGLKCLQDNYKIMIQEERQVEKEQKRLAREKAKQEEEERMKQLKLRLEDEVSQLNGFKLCKKCNRHTISPDSPCYKKLCLSCWNENRKETRKDTDMRPCIDCKRFLIKLDDPEWRVRCGSCYYNLKNPNQRL